jgi:hypothetical protein
MISIYISLEMLNNQIILIIKIFFFCFNDFTLLVTNLNVMFNIRCRLLHPKSMTNNTNGYYEYFFRNLTIKYNIVLFNCIIRRLLHFFHSICYRD